jgi:hypothetical protein
MCVCMCISGLFTLGWSIGNYLGWWGGRKPSFTFTSLGFAPDHHPSLKSGIRLKNLCCHVRYNMKFLARLMLGLFYLYWHRYCNHY